MLRGKLESWRAEEIGEVLGPLPSMTCSERAQGGQGGVALAVQQVWETPPMLEALGRCRSHCRPGMIVASSKVLAVAGALQTQKGSVGQETTTVRLDRTSPRDEDASCHPFLGTKGRELRWSAGP